MKSFEEQKEEYSIKLIDHMEFVAALSKSDREKDKKMAKLLVYPKDELELRLANAVLDFFYDFGLFMEAVMCDNVETVPLKEDKGLNLLIDYLHEIKDGKEPDGQRLYECLTNADSEEELAELYFNLFANIYGHTDKVCDYIVEELDLDLDNSDDEDILNTSLNAAKECIEKLSASTKDAIDDITEKSVVEAENLARSFHELCEKRIKKENDIFKELLKMIIEKID